MIKKDFIKYAIHLISYSLMWFFIGALLYASKDKKNVLYIIWAVCTIISYATILAGWSTPWKKRKDKKC